jgi:hypothetical protein
MNLLIYLKINIDLTPSILLYTTMFNIVAIDPSLISTALIISNSKEMKVFNYCRQSAAEGKSGLKKWFKLAEGHIQYKYIEYGEYENYSEGEIRKLRDYDKVTDIIISDILENIDSELPTKIGIEGYSFSSAAADSNIFIASSWHSSAILTKPSSGTVCKILRISWVLYRCKASSLLMSLIMSALPIIFLFSAKAKAQINET